MAEKKTDEKFDVNTMSENHISNVPDMPDVPGVKVIIHGNSEYEVTDENGNVVETESNENTISFMINKELHEEKNLTYRINVLR